MAGERRCAKCRFFKDAGISGNGWCTHPKRQHTTDNLLLVRAGELACRNDWGGDLFQNRDEASQDVEGVADLPAASRDDEVTSVVTRPERAPDGIPEEDRVVSDRPAPHRRDDDDDPWNDAAHREQEERARIIARGSRDALMHARERHSSRRNRSQQGADDAGDSTTASPDRVVTHQERFTDRSRSRLSASSYGGDPVPRAEIESRQSSGEARYESVPEIDPNFDLPGWRGNRGEPAEPAAPAQEPPAEPGAAPVQHPAYESVLQRARRTRQQRLHNRQIRHMRSAQQDAQEAPAEAPAAPEPDDQIVMATEPEPAPAPPMTPDIPITDDAGAATPSAEEPIASEALPADMYGDAEEPDDEAYYGEPGRFEEPYAPWETHRAEADDDLDDWYEEVPAPRRERAPRGLLSRLGLGQRAAATWHDETATTRHAEPELVPEPEPFDGPRDDDAADAPLEAAAATPWEDEPEARPRRSRRDAAPRTRWTDDAVPEDDAAYDNIRTYRHDFAEEDLAPIPGPVPSARPRHEPMHRQRMARELPDLDDNLFEERFDHPRPEPPSPRAIERDMRASEPVDSRQPEAPVTRARDEAPHEPFPNSPRDSFFRAAKYRDWAAAHSPVTDAEEREVDLPDLAEHDFDLRDVVARGGELLDMTIDIAPDIPRECRTCRSFRSADGGARGWCTNEWAFTHRRMVNEDDLACDSTVGCWWLPADRYRFAEEQEGYPPTPRMDALIARLTDGEEPREHGRTTG